MVKALAPFFYAHSLALIQLSKIGVSKRRVRWEGSGEPILGSPDHVCLWENLSHGWAIAHP